MGRHSESEYQECIAISETTQSNVLDKNFFIVYQSLWFPQVKSEVAIM